MAVTPASLIAAHPEFAAAVPAVVQAMIDYALLICDADAYAEQWDHAVTLYACHLLALAPDGRPMRLDPEGRAGRYSLSATVYGSLWSRLQRSAVCGLGRVV